MFQVQVKTPDPQLENWQLLSIKVRAHHTMPTLRPELEAKDG